MAFLIGGANSAVSAAYDVANSCRFNQADDPSIRRLLTSDGNVDKFTISMWVKRGKIGVQGYLCGASPGGDNDFHINFESDDTLRFYQNTSGSVVGKLQTTRVFRDCSAWYHLVFVWDTGNATAGNRMRMYVNGVEETVFGTDTQPAQDANSFWMDATEGASGSPMFLGAYDTASSPVHFDGYIAEFCMCDGQTLAASDFGEFDSDSPTIWKPKDVSGVTFGTNGVYLDFEASDNLGNDANGGTDWTEDNLDATDSATDTPTNNFCTLNPLIMHHTSTGALVTAQGNCHLNEATHVTALGTMGSTTMKFYYEYKLNSSAADVSMGVMGSNFPQATSGHAYNDPGAYGFYGETSSQYKITAGSWASDSTFSEDGIYHFAIDPVGNKLWVGKDGTWDGDPAAGTGNIVTLGTHEYLPWIHISGSAGDNSASCNFGGCSSFTVSSGNADADGYGNFEFAVPSGFYALCTKNLAEYG